VHAEKEQAEARGDPPEIEFWSHQVASLSLVLLWSGCMPAQPPIAALMQMDHCSNNSVNLL
jgi:hypothetical protein